MDAARDARAESAAMPPQSSPSATGATAGQIALWGALMVAVIWLSLRGWGTFQLGVYQDDASYTVLARSLARGGPYGLINEPGTPSPPRFGFGFPLLLAPVVKAFPDTMEGLSAVSLAATLLNISLLFWGWPLLSPTTSRWMGLATTSLYALSPETIGCTRMVMSEPAFTSLVLIGILLTERCCVRRRAGGWAPAALGVVLAAAAFTRTIGVMLGAAALLRLAFANRARLVLLVALSGAGAVALVLILTPVEPRHLMPIEYLDYLQSGVVGPVPFARTEGFAHQLLRVSGGYLGQYIRRTVVAIGTGERERAVMARLGLPWDPAIAGILISAVIAIGVYRAVQARALCRTALVFEAFYAAVLLVWAWNLVRYLYPIQPLLAFQFLFGVGWLCTRLTRRRRDPELRARWAGRAIAVTWAVLIALAGWKSLAIGDSRQFTRDLTAGASWLAANSAEESIVMARFPESVYLYQVVERWTPRRLRRQSRSPSCSTSAGSTMCWSRRRCAGVPKVNSSTTSSIGRC